jgi:hypothetical protein
MTDLPNESQCHTTATKIMAKKVFLRLAVGGEAAALLSPKTPVSEALNDSIFA